MEKELVEFIEKFFRNLGATVILQGDFLIVANVPIAFEKFYGKKSPYKFVFDKTKLIPESELIEKGAYILKAISNYLESSGQTTLLKINFEIDPEEEIKKRVRLVNCQIEKLIPKKRNNFFFRFTFHTIFQYLNEKEKSVNNIYVHNGKAIDGNLSDYPMEEGIKEEVKIPDIKEPYFIAKDELRNKIKSRTGELVLELNSKLKSEKERIEKHFIQENKEFSELLKKSENRLIELEISRDYEKISRQKRTISGLKEKTNNEELDKDKERAIQIEKQKHSLNIKNKLFNTTLIYYPLHNFNCILKSNFSKRMIEISFDPLTEELKNIICESCKKNTREIFLCRTGHISCRDCFTLCDSCGKEYCQKCIKAICETCGKKICNDCAVRCFRCGKLMCVAHTKNDFLSNRIYCNNCLRHCERCGQLREPYSFKKSPRTDVEICETCFRNEMQKKALEGVFD
jgi:hypothetical protein